MASDDRGDASLKKYEVLLASRPTGLVAIEATICLSLTLGALVGNLLVLWIVYKNCNLRTIPNQFVVSLALADVIMAGIGQPPCLSSLIAGRRPFGDFVCQMQGFLVAMLATVSLLTLTLVAINRFFLIVHPHIYRKYFTPKRTRLMIGAAWFLACTEPLPYLLSGHRYVFHAGKFFCFQVLEVDFYTLMGYIFVALPMFVMTLCYYKVFKALKEHQKKMRRTSRASEHNNAEITVEEINVTKTLFLTVCGFLICWSPIVVVDFIGFGQGQWLLPRQVYVMYTYLGQLSTMVNPVIYGVMNKTFREEYRKIFRIRWVSSEEEGNSSSCARASEQTPETQESICPIF